MAQVPERRPRVARQFIACFAYPKDKFQDKPTFIAATFFVAEASGLKTEQACVQKSPNWMVTGT